MSSVYVNLLGNWTNLKNTDTINGEPVEDFVRELLPSEKFNTANNNGFCKVSYNNVEYIVHFTQIQFIY